MRRKKNLCLLFPDSLHAVSQMETITWRCVGPNKYLLKLNNKTNRRRLWTKHLCPKHRFWSLESCSVRLKNSPQIPEPRTHVSAACEQSPPFKTNCCNLFPNEGDLLMLLLIFSGIHHECFSKLLWVNRFKLPCPRLPRPHIIPYMALIFIELNVSILIQALGLAANVGLQDTCVHHIKCATQFLEHTGMYAPLHYFVYALRPLFFLI